MNIKYQHYVNDDIIQTKFHNLSNFLKTKNKFKHTLIFDGKPFSISNKELFVEHLINLLNIPEKYLLYTIFILNKNHFITSRPNLLNIFKNNIEFTKYIIYNSLQTYISIKALYSHFTEVENDWANYILDRLREDSEYNQYAFSSCLCSLNNSFTNYKLVINYKYLFEINDFTKNFWRLYQNLIFHPHIIYQQINHSRVLTLISNNNYYSKEESIFRYLNEHLSELNINNIYELFDSCFITFILNNTIEGTNIPCGDITYDRNFNQFIKYCRKNINKNV